MSALEQYIEKTKEVLELHESIQEKPTKIAKKKLRLTMDAIAKLKVDAKRETMV
jgi:hypothetical protein